VIGHISSNSFTPTNSQCPITEYAFSEFSVEPASSVGTVVAHSNCLVNASKVSDRCRTVIYRTDFVAEYTITFLIKMEGGKVHSRKMKIKVHCKDNIGVNVDLSQVERVVTAESASYWI